MGRWAPVASLRDSVLFAFPRAVWGRVLQLADLIALGRSPVIVGVGKGPGGLGPALGVSRLKPLPVGTLLFSPPYPPRDEGGSEQPGCVYLLLEQYDGVGRPKCAHLHDGGSAAARRRWEEGGSVPLRLDDRSLALGIEPYRPDPSPLYLATHLGEPLDEAEPPRPRGPLRPRGPVRPMGSP